MGFLQDIASYLFPSSTTRSSSLEDPSTPINGDTLEIGDNYSSASGTNVTPTRALGYSALYSAVDRISNDCAKLPLNVFKKTNIGRSVQDQHPVQRRIHRFAKANEEIVAFKFWKRHFASALLWGNSFAWIDRSNRGEVLGLYQLLPDRTWMERTNGRLVCVTETSRGQRTLDPNNVLHLEGLSIDSVEGLRILKLFRNDFGKALAAQNFESKFFKNNMSAGGILQAKAGTDPKKVRHTEKLIQEKYSGSDNAFKTLVIRDAMQWINTQIDPQKAQLTLLKEDGIRDVARMYRLPPSYLGLRESISFNSEEAAKQNYYDSCLSPWLIQNAAECTVKLLSEEERNTGHFCEYNINALLWADAITRSTIASIGIQSGRFCPNETRAWENYDSYEGGDQFYRQLNLEPSGVASRSIASHLRPLLEATFQRAINRIDIRNNRNKTLSEDRSAVVAIVDGPLRNVAALAGENYAGKADSWFDSLLSVDASSLRAHAEASSQRLLNELFKPVVQAG
jgi:HK97 family phage portal protein